MGLNDRSEKFKYSSKLLGEVAWRLIEALITVQKAHSSTNVAGIVETQNCCPRSYSFDSHHCTFKSEECKSSKHTCPPDLIPLFRLTFALQLKTY